MVCILQEAVIDGLIGCFLPWKSADSENAWPGLRQGYWNYILPMDTADLSWQYNLLPLPETITVVHVPAQSDSTQYFAPILSCEASCLLKCWEHTPASQRLIQSQKETIIVKMTQQACLGKSDSPLLLKGTTASSHCSMILWPSGS